MKITKIFVLLAMIFSFVACEDEKVSVGPRPDLNIVDILKANGYDLLVDAIDHAGLRTTLETTNNITVLAPNNNAFTILMQQLGVQSISEIPAAELAEVLRYHVVTGGAYASANLPRKAPTVEGSNLYFTGSSKNSVNAKASIVLSNRSGNNGIFHGISVVLTAPQSSIMDQIIERSEAGTPQFTLLRHALERAGLDDDLQGGDFTLFAPTNAAFTAVGLGTTAAIDGLPLDFLTTVLQYHVLPAATFSVDLANGRIGTANGSPAAENSVKGVDVNASTPSIEAATIQVINTLATNGTWHQVSALILPKVGLKEGATTSASLGNATLDGAADNFGLLITASGYDKLDAINRSARNAVYFPRVPPSVASFGGDTDAMIEYIERHIFPVAVNLSTANNGTKVTSIGGDEYYVAVDAGGIRYVNGLAASRNPFTPATTSFTAYDGTSYLWGTAGYTGLVPLPATTITEMLAGDADFELFSAALEITGKDADFGTGNKTLFALDDATFSSETGISDPAVILGLDPDDEDDAELIETLAEVIDRHTINSVNFWIYLNTVRPTIANVLGEDVFFGVVGGNTVIIEDNKDPQNNFVSITTPNRFTAKNGVVHVVNKIFEF